MNSDFGTFAKLPFDLHLHRKPVLYHLADASDKERYGVEKQMLTDRLVEAIGLMVKDIEATEAPSARRCVRRKLRGG